MYFQQIQLVSSLKCRTFLAPVVSLALTSQFLAIALLTSPATAAETKPSAKQIYFSSPYAVRHCFITIPQEQRCLFRDEGAVVPVEVHNPTFRNRWLSDISTHMAHVGEYDRAIQLES
jgi:hypothetical protein